MGDGAAAAGPAAPSSKGRLTKLEQAFANKPQAQVREGVRVKRLVPEGEDVYGLAQSDARIEAAALEWRPAGPCPIGSTTWRCCG